MVSVILTGIDIGTSSIKAVGFKPTGDKIFDHREDISLHIHENNPEYVEQDPHEIFQKFLRIIRNVMLSCKGEDIVIGLSSTSPSVVAISSDGEPLSRIITWLDRRAENECRKIIDKLGMWEIYSRTGLRPDSIFTAPKIMWMKEHTPDIFRKADYFVQVKDYLFFKLTREPVTDYSHASETLLFDIHRKKYYHDMIEVLELDEDNFFTPVKSEFTTNIRSDMLEKINVDKSDVYITLGGVDSACAALGIGAISSGFIADITGTSMCLDATSGKPILDKEMRFETYMHVLPESYIMEASLPTAGKALSTILNLTNYHSYPDERFLDKPSGLIFLPFLSGTRSPDWEPGLRGLVYGLSLASSRERLVRSVYEGVAFWERSIIDGFKDLGITVEEVRCGGGGASKYWLQVKADITGIPHILMREKDASAFGAALIAGKGTGIYPSYEKIAKEVIAVEEAVKPREIHRETYDSMYEKFLRLWSLVREL